MTPHPKKVKPKFKTVKAWALILPSTNEILKTATEVPCTGQYCRHMTSTPKLFFISPEKPDGLRALMPFVKVEIRIPTKRGKR